MKNLSLCLIKVIAIGVIFLTPVTARADQSIPLVKVLCMTEPGISHFSADVESFSQLSAYINHGRGENPVTDKLARLKTLEKYGLIFASEAGFSYECALPSRAYKLEGSRQSHKEKGMCGGDPRITVSLEENGDILLDNVFFQDSCFTNRASPYVETISIDGPVAGWGEGSSMIKISNGTAVKELRLSSKYELSQATLECLVKEGFFNSKTEYQAKKICLR